MKKIVFGILLLTISTLLFSEPDFRKVNWGDSREHVIATETADRLNPESPDGVLIYNTKINNTECYLIYNFTYEKLTGAGYMLQEPETVQANNFISAFEQIQDLLIGKYGDPKSDDTEWLSDIFKKSKSDWGYALMQGDVVFNLSWIIGETRIKHLLSSPDKSNVQHIILYESLELLDSVIQSKSEGL